jgi:ABC-2 type transport system permease protein
MRKFWILFKYELQRLLVSPATYFVAAAFMLILALTYIFMLHEFVLCNQDVTFVHMFLRCFLLPILLIVPILTMRTFSEDYKTGLLQSIKTTPIGNFTVVLAKFLSAYSFYIAIWTGALLFIFLSLIFVPSLANDSSFLGDCSLGGGYLYMLLLGCPLIAAGIFFSSLTENQVLSGSLSFVAILTTLLGAQMLSLKTLSSDTFLYHTLVRPLNMVLQIDSACFRVFDSRVVVLYLGLGLMFLTFTKLVLGKNFN